MLLTSEKQARQEDAYRFPYHYIPQYRGEGFTQTISWAWGMRYLGGMEVLFDILSQRPFESLVDVGCGDGRFLALIRQDHATTRLLGIDYSQRAITLADAMSPDVRYECRDIIKETFDEHFDIVTLIEVLEHIPPPQVSEFVTSLKKLMHQESKLIVTVPHANLPVASKHFQHFTSESLRAVLAPLFGRVDLMPFDSSDLLLKILDKITCRTNLIVNWPPILKFKWQHYVNHCLRDIPERRCLRLAAICEL